MTNLLKRKEYFTTQKNCQKSSNLVLNLAEDPKLVKSQHIKLLWKNAEVSKKGAKAI